MKEPAEIANALRGLADQIEAPDTQAEVDPLEAVAAELADKAAPDMVTPFAQERLLRLKRHFLAALKRGMELKPADPTTFTHCIDADGREVLVKFFDGPDVYGDYMWRVLGEHRPEPSDELGFKDYVWRFKSDGTHSFGWPIRLIRKEPTP